MSTITIADRRAVMTASMLEADFRDLMRRDPRAGFQRATGRSAPQDARIAVLEEQPDAWEFVVPAGPIDSELPQPSDARGAIENDVYDILRDEPGVRARAMNDPKAFLAERLQFDIGDAAIHVREEQAGELLLVLPCGDSRDQLVDSALDLVSAGTLDQTSGGSAPSCNPAAKGGGATRS
jgi:hypothetical protein